MPNSLKQRPRSDHGSIEGQIDCCNCCDLYYRAVRGFDNDFSMLRWMPRRDLCDWKRSHSFKDEPLPLLWRAYRDCGGLPNFVPPLEMKARWNPSISFNPRPSQILFVTRRAQWEWRWFIPAIRLCSCKRTATQSRAADFFLPQVLFS